MTESDAAPEQKPHGIGSRRVNFTVILAVVIGIAVGAVLVTRFAGERVRGGLPVGQRIPPITAAGWLNGELPSLEGKVVVIDAWATWCGPCLKAAPKMVAVHDRFADRDDVVFVGLTGETEEAIPAIERFLQVTKIPWVNGYGASETLAALQARYIPSAWVVGKNGEIVWNYDSNGELADAIAAALEQ